jgi:hypothetical protein
MTGSKIEIPQAQNSLRDILDDIRKNDVSSSREHSSRRDENPLDGSYV